MAELHSSTSNNGIAEQPTETGDIPSAKYDQDIQQNLNSRHNDEAPKSDTQQSDQVEAPKSDTQQSDQDEAPKSDTQQSDQDEAPKTDTQQSDQDEAPKSDTQQSDHDEAPKTDTQQSDQDEAPKTDTQQSDQDEKSVNIKDEENIKESQIIEQTTNEEKPHEDVSTDIADEKESKEDETIEKRNVDEDIVQPALEENVTAPEINLEEETQQKDYNEPSNKNNDEEIKNNMEIIAENPQIVLSQDSNESHLISKSSQNAAESNEEQDENRQLPNENSLGQMDSDECNEHTLSEDENKNNDKEHVETMENIDEKTDTEKTEVKTSDIQPNTNEQLERTENNNGESLHIDEDDKKQVENENSTEHQDVSVDYYTDDINRSNNQDGEIEDKLREGMRREPAKTPTIVELSFEEEKTLREVFDIYSFEDRPEHCIVNRAGMKSLFRYMGEIVTEEMVRKWMNDDYGNVDELLEFSGVCTMYRKKRQSEEERREELSQCVHILFPTDKMPNEVIELNKVASTLNTIAKHLSFRSENSTLTKEDVDDVIQMMSSSGSESISREGLVDFLCSR